MRNALTLAALAAVLVACGGGGGDAACTNYAVTNRTGSITQMVTLCCTNGVKTTTVGEVVSNTCN